MSWDEVDSDLEPNIEAKETAMVAARMVAQHGAKEAASWARHFAYNNYDEDTSGRHAWLAIAAEIESRAKRHLDEPEMEPNPGARPLKGPAMNTRFGDTVEDPDEVNGTEGKHLDAAMDRYETFHAKKPIRVAELDHDLPKKWVAVGDALAVMYRTDKWKKDGSDIDYKHLHDKGDDKPYEFRKGVRLYEPAGEARRSKVHGRRDGGSAAKSQNLPVREPRALTMLGYCLGLFVRRYDDEEVYEVNPRGSWLFSSPSGDLLAVYSPNQQPDGSSGFLAVMAGGNLRVLKDGIDG